MIHSQSAESMDKDQNFPVSIEVQTLGGDGTNERSTGNLCTPGTNVNMDGRLITTHCISSTSKTCHGDEWVTLEIEIHGNDLIKHSVNGEIVMEYTQPQLDPKDDDAKKLIKDGNLMLDEGYIALQAESHPLEIRKVEILSLKGCMDEKAKKVDMSSEAIDLRLRRLSGLYKLGMSLKRAKPMVKMKNGAPRKAVTTPIGVSAPPSRVRPGMSARIRKAAPPISDSGTTFR